MPRFQTGRIIALFHIAFNQRLILVYMYRVIVLHKKKQNETNNKFYIDGPSGGVSNERTNGS
jgi:hypothetical protein